MASVMISNFFKKGHPRPLLVYFGSFQTIYRIKIVDFSEIRTWIGGVEGDHADHLTTATAQEGIFLLKLYKLKVKNILLM